MLLKFFRDHTLILVFALAKLFLHLIVNAFGGYDYFRDEFYYLACADRLDWGYVDHPPLSIVLLWLNRLLFGDSLFALRLLPAVAGAGTVVLTGLLVKELGGKLQAQLVALTAVVITPVLLILADFYSMNAYEPLFWLGAAYILLRIQHGGRHHLWLLFGVVAGLGLQNKHSMVFFGVAIVVGLVLTKERMIFRNRWFWIGGLVAMLLFLPNLIWQLAHNWPTLEFARNAQQWKNLPMSPIEFFLMQVIYQHPLTLPLWLGGLVALFFHPNLKAYRAFGYSFIFLFVLFVVQRGKPYYLSPFFPILLASGAVAFEGFFERRNWKNAMPTYAAILGVGGIILMPLVLPVLPVETFIRYAEPFGLAKLKTERHAETVLPQTFADRFGWREMVETVAGVVDTLPDEERKRTIIYCQNYGEAGAIEFFGRKKGLPPAVTGHNSYWWWGIPIDSVETVIIVGGDEEDHRTVFHTVELVATHHHPYAMRYESDLPLFVCRGWKLPMPEVWKTTRRYN